MGTVTVGRTLDEDSEPIPGTGFDVDPDSRVAGYLADRTTPLVSNPVTGDWIVGLVSATETGGEFARGLGIFSAGSTGPPEHYHVGYEESFEILRSEFVFDVDGDRHRLEPGDEITVPPETPHSLQNVGDDVGITVTETRPAARTLDVVRTQFGLAQDGKVDDDGKPGFMRGLVLASAMADDTVFTSPPPAIALPVAKVLAPLARLAGYEAVEERYQNDQFWYDNVEQPPF